MVVPFISSESPMCSTAAGFADFFRAERRSLSSPLYERLDHHYLNEYSRLENRTRSEVLAQVNMWRSSAAAAERCPDQPLTEPAPSGCIFAAMIRILPWPAPPSRKGNFLRSIPESAAAGDRAAALNHAPSMVAIASSKRATVSALAPGRSRRCLISASPLIEMPVRSGHQRADARCFQQRCGQRASHPSNAEPPTSRHQAGVGAP